jgi:hypothetical protein
MSARIGLLLTAIVLAAPLSASKWVESGLANAGETRAPGSMIRVVSRHGAARVETLDGVGCSEAICSRVFIRALVEDEEGTTVQNIRFDSVAAIEMLGAGEARVRFIDGIVKRVLVAADNRVLYVVDQAGRRKKVDLSDVASIEFLR